MVNRDITVKITGPRLGTSVRPKPTVHIDERK